MIELDRQFLVEKLKIARFEVFGHILTLQQTDLDLKRHQSVFILDHLILGLFVFGALVVQFLFNPEV